MHKLQRGSTAERQATATQARIEALRMLAPFLALPADVARRAIAAVEAVVTDLFPTLSHELPRGSTQATEYGLQLTAMMDAAVATAESGTRVEAFLEVRSCPLKVCQALCCGGSLQPSSCNVGRHWQKHARPFKHSF